MVPKYIYEFITSSVRLGGTTCDSDSATTVQQYFLLYFYCQKINFFRSTKQYLLLNTLAFLSQYTF